MDNLYNLEKKNWNVNKRLVMGVFNRYVLLKVVNIEYKNIL